MNLLLQDRLAPITSEIGFLEAKCADATQAYAAWYSHVLAPNGMGVRVDPVSTNTFEAALRALLPLTSVIQTRSLFLPTESRWTAFFGNDVNGTNPMAPMSYLAKVLGCRGLRVVAVPEGGALDCRANSRYGASILEIFGPEDRSFLNCIRSIAAVNDGGRWEFVQSGTPQDFEEPQRYRARAVRDRFTFEILSRYLAALEVDAFNEAFYVPSDGFLATKTGRLPPTLVEYSLEEARARL